LEKPSRVPGGGGGVISKASSRIAAWNIGQPLQAMNPPPHQIKIMEIIRHMCVGEITGNSYQEFLFTINYRYSRSKIGYCWRWKHYF
jgi:hypothetical protein